MSFDCKRHSKEILSDNKDSLILGGIYTSIFPSDNLNFGLQLNPQGYESYLVYLTFIKAVHSKIIEIEHALV